MNNTNIAKDIYAIMDCKHMNQAKVAQAAGFSAHQFNAMLRGRKIIRSEYIPRICAALYCTPNELFNFSEKR